MGIINSQVRPASGEFCSFMTAEDSVGLLEDIELLMGPEGFHGKADAHVCSPRHYGDAHIYGETRLMVINLIGDKPHQLVLIGASFGKEDASATRATAKLLALLGFGEEESLYEWLSWPTNPENPENSHYEFRRWTI